MPSININVQDIFTPLLSINADIETIKTVCWALYQMSFSLRTDISQKCFNNQWKWDRESENEENKTEIENTLMKKDRHFGVVQMYLKNKL